MLNIQCTDVGAIQAIRQQTGGPALLTSSSSNLPAFRVTVETDLSDHVLAVGPRYQIDDMRCNVVSTLGENTSGLLREFLYNSSTRVNRFYLSRCCSLPQSSA